MALPILIFVCTLERKRTWKKCLLINLHFFIPIFVHFCLYVRQPSDAHSDATQPRRLAHEATARCAPASPFARSIQRLFLPHRQPPHNCHQDYTQWIRGEQGEKKKRKEVLPHTSRVPITAVSVSFVLVSLNHFRIAVIANVKQMQHVI
jgi:hypothetical protein